MRSFARARPWQYLNFSLAIELTVYYGIWSFVLLHCGLEGQGEESDIHDVIPADWLETA